MRIERLVPVITFALILACSHGSEGPEPFGSLTADQVHALIQKGEVSVFDNNSPARYKKSHLPTAKWLQYDGITAADLPADKNRQLVFYCANEH